MLYMNTYLDKLGTLVRGEADVGVAYELTDEEKIFEMFRRDCEKVIKLYKQGKAEYGEAKKNFSLLKFYVVSQLALHFNKVKEMAKAKGVEINKELTEDLINRISLQIDKMEKML